MAKPTNAAAIQNCSPVNDAVAPADRRRRDAVHGTHQGRDRVARRIVGHRRADVRAQAGDEHRERDGDAVVAEGQVVPHLVNEDLQDEDHAELPAEQPRVEPQREEDRTEAQQELRRQHQPLETEEDEEKRLELCGRQTERDEDPARRARAPFERVLVHRQLRRPVRRVIIMHEPVVLAPPVPLREWRPALPKGEVRSLYLHWTAHGYDEVFPAYHFCITRPDDVDRAPHARSAREHA